MLPGITSKISESVVVAAGTIYPKSDMVHITDTTTTTVLVTIVPPYEGFSGLMILVNRSGANITATTAGNILATITLPNNQSMVLTYSKLAGKWIPGSDA